MKNDIVYVVQDMFDSSKIVGIFQEEASARKEAEDLSEKNTGRRDTYDLRYEISSYQSR